MLNCDCCTLAAEVPVWVDSKKIFTSQRGRERRESVSATSPLRSPRLCEESFSAAGLRVPHDGSLGEFALPNNSEPGTLNSELIAGHIDLLQWKFDTLYILDFKPNAARASHKATQGKPHKLPVLRSLGEGGNLYALALALAKRANLSLEKIRCAWFDEEDFFSFTPQDRLPIET